MINASIKGAFAPPLILAVLFTGLIAGCDTFSTSNDREAFERPDPEPPSLTVRSACDSTAQSGTITAFSENAEEYAVISLAEGDTVSRGTFETDSISVPVPDGDYEVVAANDGGTTSKNASLDCEDVPLQPGLSFSRVCNSNQGELTITAANGVTSYELVYLETGEVVAESSDLEPEEDWTKTFTDLADGDYRFDAVLEGEEESVEPSFNCDGPGQITIDKTCNSEQGDVTATVENGARSWELFRDGEKIDGESGLTPEEDQVIELGDDLADGQYTLEVSRSGETNEREFTINCDIPGPGTINVDASCVDEDGQFVVSSSNGFEIARVLDSDGNIVEEKTGFDPENDPEAVFEGIADGDLTVEVERNDKTDSEEETVNCDIPGPETPTLISNECAVDPYDGILVFDVDSDADTFELRDADTDEIVRDGSINGRSELEFSGLADGDYYLVVTRNDKDASSGTTTVECDLITRLCEFLFDGDKFVDGLDKSFIEPLSDDEKVVFTFEPVKPPRMMVDIRLSQGDQIKEAYAIGFVADSDTIFTQIRPDQDNSGSGERWLTDQFEMEQSTLDQFEIGKAYEIIAVHGGYLDPDLALGGAQSVFFSTEEPTGEDGETGGRVVIESDKTP